MAKKTETNWKARAKWLMDRAATFSYFGPGHIGYFQSHELDWKKVDAFIKTKHLGHPQQLPQAGRE